MITITIEVNHQLIEGLQEICDADNTVGDNKDTSDVHIADDESPVRINWVQHEDEKWINQGEG
jgi:hypothetical protein